MASAPFVWRRDGRPDWSAMWTTFCDLALHGGPPQRGALQALRGPSVDGRAARSAPEIAAELRRGIEETTGLGVEAAEPGWIAITCASARMAAWLCAAIILENVDARVEGTRLLVPAGPGFALEDQVKSVVTVVAKTHHYWREHLESARETRS
jgi:sirohydrochlorin cobaltochelatase